MQSWLDRVEQVAHEAAMAEERERAGLSERAERLPSLIYRWEHVQQVVHNGVWLLDHIDADRDIVLAACWLHDVRKREENHADKGATFARELLAKTDFPTEKIDRVAEAIAQHEGLWRPAAGWSEDSGTPFRPAPPLKPVESALLWDADKLTKVGPLALLHFLPMHLFDLQQKGESTTTRSIVERNRWYLDNLVPGILASFNTLAAQRRGMKLHAALEMFWSGVEEAVGELPTPRMGFQTL